ERELGRNPTLAGKVTVEFTIVERGTVSNARAAENTTGSPAVASCVTAAVRRFRFRPGPEGGSVTFRYPFVFAPQN
ncbi:MAG: AgmX/PglI C-terminal domain-containing protein, partial [Myxococcota bacterium]